MCDDRVTQLHAFDAVCVEEKLWLASRDSNGLFYMDINTKEIHFSAVFGNEIERDFLFKKIIRYKDYIILLPANSKNLYVFNYITQEVVTSIRIGDEDFNVVAEAFLIGNTILILPGMVELDMLSLNMDTLVVSKVKEFKEECLEHIEKSNGYFTRFCIEDENIYFHLPGTSKVARWNIKKKILSVFNTEISNIFSASYHSGNFVIICDDTYDIFQFSISGDGIRRVYEKNGECSKRPYNNIILWADSFLILPAYSNDILVMKNETVRILYTLDDEIGMHPFMFGTAEVGDELWLIPFAIDVGMKIGRDLEIIERIPFEISKTVEDTRWNTCRMLGLVKEGVVYEFGQTDLKGFLYCVKAFDI